jgi:hypothetical protein
MLKTNMLKTNWREVRGAVCGGAIGVAIPLYAIFKCRKWATAIHG